MVRNVLGPLMSMKYNYKCTVKQDNGGVSASVTSCN